ncbi:MAG: ribbon-helix-helix protein, CopG family, partial [Candidatus Nanopelagicales bacterium]|nr:ribbon-helix-helix protein, CopG family [Candidatus Nanopelagicales bacterium]
MTLRLQDDEVQALSAQAAREKRSRQEIVRQAVREYIERNGRQQLLDEILDG